jgi:hypothetical protein
MRYFYRLKERKKYHHSLDKDDNEVFPNAEKALNDNLIRWQICSPIFGLVLKHSGTGILLFFRSYCY